MARITGFVAAAERILKAKADVARQAILDLDLPPTATESMLVTISRHENGGVLPEWRFVMLNPLQCLAVWNAIEELPAEKRPRDVDRAFKLVITHVEQNTGIVTLTREEMAVRMRCPPQEVSKAMGVLAEMKVIFRERIKTPGMRGPGVARYRVNQWVAWNGKLELRAEQAQQVPLPFVVVQGGR
jgi:hypothetical protein